MLDKRNKNMKRADPLKIIRFLLGFKIIILTGFILHEFEVIKFGEISLFAQKNSSQKAEEANTEYYEEKNIPEIHELLDIKTASEKEKKKVISRYLDIIEKRKQETEIRINQLATREAQIKKMESVIDKKLKDLEEERLYIVQTIQKEKKIKDERMTKLIALYGKMEPKKAAPVFEEIDKDLAAALFKELKQKQVTAILEQMNPDKAVELTEYFGRIKSGAEYDVLREMNKSLVDAFKDCKTQEKTTQESVSTDDGKVE